MNLENNNDGTLNFRCPKTGELVTVDDCFDCLSKMSCDMYATMLDEQK